MKQHEQTVPPLAFLLRDYLRDRAAVEGKEFGLPISFFVEIVELGVMVCGITHDGNQILGDRQEPRPGYLAEWLRTHAV